MIQVYEACSDIMALYYICNVLECPCKCMLLDWRSPLKVLAFQSYKVEAALFVDVSVTVVVK